MSGQNLLIILLIGLVAGWLAGQIVKGTGFGLIADIAIGFVGAFIGSWLLPHGNCSRHHRRHRGCAGASSRSPTRLSKGPVVTVGSSQC